MQPHAQMANDSERLIAKRTAEARDFKQKLADEKRVSADLRRQLEERNAEFSSLSQKKSSLELVVEKDQERIAKLKADLSAALKVADEATAQADELENVEHQKIKNAGIAEYQQKVLLGLMSKARKDSFDEGYLLGVRRCKHQVARDFPEARLDITNWVVKSDDEDEEEEGEEGEEGDGEVPEGGLSEQGGKGATAGDGGATVQSGEGDH